MHSVLVSLLIASILACPYECAVRLVAAQSSPQVKKACCETCRARNMLPLNESSTPHQQPASDDDGVCCLCEGAVFCVTAQQVVDDAIHSYGVVAVLAEGRLPQLYRRDQFLTACESSPANAGGLFVRILNQSFLL